jgi:hypothetical protein
MNLPAPDPELIAAFLDGGLSAEEAAQVRMLLADSAEWREVMLEAQALEEALQNDLGAAGRAVTPGAAKPPEGAIVGAPGTSLGPLEPSDVDGPIQAANDPGEFHLPPPRSAGNRAWLAAVAAIVLLGVSAPYWLRVLAPGPAPSGTLVERIAAPEALAALAPEWSDPEWRVLRGGEPVSAAASTDFRLGVLAVKLALADRLGQPTTAKVLADSVRSTLDSDLSPLAVAVGQEIAPQVERLGSPATQPAERAAAAEAIDRELLLSFGASDHFHLGRWAASSLLAARAGNREYFRQEVFRKGLREAGAADVVTGVEDELAILAEVPLEVSRAEPALVALIEQLADPRADLDR